VYSLQILINFIKNLFHLVPPYVMSHLELARFLAHIACSVWKLSQIFHRNVFSIRDWEVEKQCMCWGKELETSGLTMLFEGMGVGKYTFYFYTTTKTKVVKAGLRG